MYRIRVKGRADYDQVCQKDFEEVVEVPDALGHYKYDAIQKLHPDWTAINCISWEEV